MEISLSRKSWHYRLQRYVFRSETPDLYSLCPYFWLTMLCIVILPIIFLARMLESVADSYDESVANTQIDKWLDSLDGKSAYVLSTFEKIAGKPFSFKKIDWFELFYMWRGKMHARGKTDEEINKFLTRGEERNRNIVQEIADELKRKKRQKEEKKRAWMPLIVWTQRFFNVVITVGLMTLLSYAVNFVVMNFNPHSFVQALVVLVIVALMFAFAVGVVKLIQWYIEQCKVKNHTPWIVKPFMWIGNGIGSFFLIFFEYFKANKNDYCPGLDWTD